MSGTRKEVASLLGEGRTPLQIATELGVARNTVYYHLRRLREEADRGTIEADVAVVVPPRSSWSVTTREDVRRLLDEGLTKADVAARLGISKATVSYHVRRLGGPIDVRCARRYDWREIQAFHDSGHSTRECAAAFGFSLESWHAARRRGDLKTRPPGLPLDELLVRNAVRSRGNIKRRLLVAGVKLPRCERCRAERWLDEPVPLDLHHINGIRDDNRLENLMLLCPNCHALIEGEGAGRAHADH